MSLVRRIARPMLASIFIAGGIDALRDPKPETEMAEDTAPRAADAVSAPLPIELPRETESLVKINAGVMVGAGLLLAAGRFPRLAALALAGTLVPTTAAAHRFWEESDPAIRALQQQHFLKNCGLFGGLLIAAVDTGGRESLPRRARRAASGAGVATRRRLPGS